MLTPEHDAILAEYEPLWRDAMLRDVRQWRMGMRGLPLGGDGTCAVVLARMCGNEQRDLLRRVDAARLLWRCECGRLRHSLADVLVHLNDEHAWTWDQFANKSRDALDAGLVRARALFSNGGRHDAG